LPDYPTGAQYENNDGLTRRERECLLLLAQGLRSEEITERLKIAKVTVDFHVSNAKNKLNAATREQAVAIVVQRGLLDTDEHTEDC
jgi:LuxR family transcriptional regulator, activator of conjugal transfer of Ti plasmids